MNISASETDKAISIFRAVRLTQLNNRYVSTAHDTELSLADSHLLIEFSRPFDTSFLVLGKRLGLDRSTISRSVNGLAAQGLLDIAPSPDHGRRLSVSLTTNGKKVLSEFDSAADESMTRLSGNLTKEERPSFVSLLKSFADGLAASPDDHRLHEHRLRPEIRRITRAFGLLGPRVFKSPLNSLQWHILSELQQGNFNVAIDLCNHLQVAHNTLSGSLLTLERARLITRKYSQDDKRRQLIALTKLGTKALSELEKSASMQIGSALKHLSAAELGLFTELFLKFALGDGRNIDPPPAFGAVTPLDPEQLTDARAIALFHLVRLNWHGDAPALLLGPESYNFGLFNKGVLVGVSEIQRRKNRWHLSLLITAAAISDSNTLDLSERQHLLTHTLRIFFESEGRSQLHIDPVVHISQLVTSNFISSHQLQESGLKLTRKDYEGLERHLLRG